MRLVQKKAIKLGKIDVNQPISGFFEGPTLPVWRALRRKVFFFTSRGPVFSVIKVLVDAGAKLDIEDSNGDNPLHRVLKDHEPDKYPEVAQYLIQTGLLDLDQVDRAGKAAIHYVVDLKNVKTLQALVKGKANLNLKSKPGHYPLITAINNKWSSGVKALINAGADLSISTRSGETVLHRSISMKLNNIAIDLVGRVKKKVINQQNTAGTTALDLALRAQHLKLTRKLLKANASVNISDNVSNLPLHRAVIWNNQEILKSILSKTKKSLIDTLNENGNSALYIATERGFPKTMGLLLRSNTDVNLENEKGDTPLHIAVKKDFVSGVQLLLSSGAKPNVQDVKGNTSLHLSNSVKISKMLMDAGAQLEIENLAGETPIVVAMMSKGEKVFMFYAKAGAEVTWVGDKDTNLLHMATSKGFNQALGFLVKKVDVNARKTNQRTAMFSARTVKTLNILVKNGAKVEVEDARGNSAFTNSVVRYLSRESDEHLAVVKRFIDLGANVNHTIRRDRTVIFSALGWELDNTPRYYSELMAVLLKSDMNLNIQDDNGKTALFFANTPEEIYALKKGSLFGPVDTEIKDNDGKTYSEILRRKILQYDFEIKSFNKQIEMIDVEISELNASETTKLETLKKRKQVLEMNRDVFVKEIEKIEVLKKATDS